ncbi:MAG: fibronectin type III domain-containing protein [Bacteroidia bacterium]|nr:fibronectin type III domain-containing protein [Bacteroidia bacterium]MDW8159193.1 fibronectin type III domain-containing protein [Bacteroidia bacterium]
MFNRLLVWFGILLLFGATSAWGQCEADVYYQDGNNEINLSSPSGGRDIFCNTDPNTYKLFFKPKNANAIIRNPTFVGAAVRQGAIPGDYALSVKDLPGKTTKDGQEYIIYLNYLDKDFRQITCEAKIKVQASLNLIITGLKQDRQYCQSDDQEYIITVRKQPNDDIGNDDIPDGILEIIPDGRGAPIAIPKSGASYKYTYKFKPSNYPPGTHILRFRSTTNNEYKCQSIVDISFEITRDPGNPQVLVNGSTINDNEVRCIAQNELTRLTARLGDNPLTVGVSFSSPSSGLVNNLNETTFDPRVAGPGRHSITFRYQVGGCIITKNFQLQVVDELPDFSFPTPAYLCADNAGNNRLNLDPKPNVAGATFSINPVPGAGAIVGNTLFPGRITAFVNPEVRYQITYSGNLPDGCRFSISKDFFLRAPKPDYPKFNFEKGLAFCTRDVPFAISALPTGGKFEVIDPSTGVPVPSAIQTAGIAGDEKIDFSVLSARIPDNAPYKKFILRYKDTIPPNPEQDPCPYDGEIEFFVSKPPTPQLTLSQKVFAICSATTNRKFELTGNYDELAQNISFAGLGVKKEHGKWIFEPLVAGEGRHVITYKLKLGSCEAEAQDTVVVFNPPRVEVQNLKQEYCNSEGLIRFRILPPRGSFVPAHLATAISPDNSDPSNLTYILDVSKLPVGNQVINYAVTIDGCTASQSIRINVKAGPEANIGGIVPVICQTRGALQLNPQPAGGTLTLDPPISGALVGNILYVNNLPPAEYKISYSGKDPLSGCSYGVTVPFRVANEPISASPADIGLPTKICKEQSIVRLNFSSVPPSFPKNGIFSGPGIQQQGSQFSFDPNLAGPGVHVIHYSGVIDNCPYNFVYRVEVPLTAIAVEPSFLTLCQGQEATLRVIDVFNAGYTTYNWSPAPKLELDPPKKSEVIVSPSRTTIYNVTAGDQNDPNKCPASTTAIVRVVEPGAVNTLVQDVTRSGFWDGRVTATFDSLPAGRYRIVLENLDASGTCRREVTVTVREPNCRNFDVTIEPNLAVCGGNSIVVRPQVSGGSGNYVYRWSPSSGLSSVTAAAPLVAPQQSTIYTLEVSDIQSGCRKNILVPIRVITPVDPAQIGLRSPVEVCAGSSIRLCAGGGSTYTWSPAVGLSATNTACVVAAPSQTTTYFVEVSNGDARCAARASVVVVVNPLPTAIAIPTPATCSTCLDGSVRISSSTAIAYWLEGQNNNQYQNSSIFPGLRPGVYQYRVRDARGCESVIQTVTVPPDLSTPSCNPPSAPLVSMNATHSSIELSWNAITNVVNYLVTICEENNPSRCPVERLSVTGTNLRLSWDRFVMNTRYIVRLQSVCRNRESSFSEGSIFSIPSFPAPGCLAPQIDENNYVQELSTAYRFFWASVPNASSYEFRICPASNPNDCQVLYTSINEVLVNFNSILPTERYIISVRSLCANNSISAYSNSVIFNLRSCATPSITQISYSGNLVEFQWETISSDGVTGYEIRICQANNLNNCILGSPFTVGNVNSYRISRSLLESSVEYQIEIRSICRGGLRSAYSEPLRFIAGAPTAICPPPPNAFVVSNANGNVTIEWTPVRAATTYRIEWWQTNNPNNIRVVEVSAFPSTYTFSSLIVGQTYSYRIYSICRGLLSLPSRERQFTVASNARLSHNATSPLYVVYPNPNNGQFWVLLQAERAGEAELSITDAAGRMVYREILDVVPGSNEFWITPSALNPGIYLVSITLDGRRESVRVVVH